MDAVEVLNSLPAERLESELYACCAAPAWGAAIVADRPFVDRAALLASADAASRALTCPDVLTALSAHPRMGERAAGESREAAWSRGEQAAAGAGDDTTR